METPGKTAPHLGYRIHGTISHQPGERFSSFSSGSLILRLFPQPLHVTVHNLVVLGRSPHFREIFLF